MERCAIKLEGPGAKGARVSIHVIRALSEALVKVSQRSLRLRLEGRSHLIGNTRSLEKATDMQLVGLTEGSTVIEWEAPRFGEVAPEWFEQSPLWDLSPKRDQTAFSLIEETVRDAVSGNADSDFLDRNVLDAVSEFKSVLNFGFDALVLNSRSDARIEVTMKGLAVSDNLRAEAPPSERVIVSGVLDQLTHSARGFRLILTNGQILKGVLPQGALAAYGSFWGQKVVVDGTARFKPSKAVSLIDASHIQTASSEDAIWERTPKPKPRDLEELKPILAPSPGSNGMSQVFGRWPGEETTEEILTALRELD